MTAFNESREILLTTYGYFTVNQTIEPEVGNDAVYIEVQAEYENHMGLAKTNRQPVLVSNWSAVNTDFEVDLSIYSISLWWETIENGDDSCVWTFMFYVNNESIAYEGDCQSDGTELTKETFLIEENVTLQAGDTFEVEIWYEGWEDIKIYYDNSTYDTGLNIVGKHNFFFAPSWSGSTVTIEFAEAWPVNWDTNLDAGYIMLMGDEMYMADNSKASVSEGNEYTISMANGSADVTSTIITWNEVSGNGIRLLMDYNSFDHSIGGNNTNGTVGNPPILTLNLQKASGLLGDDGGLLGLPGFELMIAIPAIAFVARKYRSN